MRMAHSGLIALLLFGLTGLAALRAAEDEKEAPAKEQTYVGMVEATRDSAQQITAVKLTLDSKEALEIKLDEKGKQLGEQLDQKRAEATGALTMEAGKKILAVATFREANGMAGNPSAAPSRPAAPAQGQ